MTNSSSNFLAGYLAFLFASAVCLGCHDSQVQAVSGQRSNPSAPNPVRQSQPKAQTTNFAEDEEKIVPVIGDALRKAHLIATPDACLSYAFTTETAEKFEVDVRENHTPPCPGDASFAPRLATVRVDRKTGKMWSDGSNPGMFRPLPAIRSSRNPS